MRRTDRNPASTILNGEFSTCRTTGALKENLIRIIQRPRAAEPYRAESVGTAESFSIPQSDNKKLFFVDFDGVYRNSEVWINGHYLGKRPYGYISFEYELTPFLKYGNEQNVLAVKVDNSQQPNSRWYSGSGIYRNVRLVTTETIHVDHWGIYITTPEVSGESATVSIRTKVKNSTAQVQPVKVKTVILDEEGNKVAEVESGNVIAEDSLSEVSQEVAVKNPHLWTLRNSTAV